MYKIIVIVLIVLIIILIGNMYITREGFQTTSVAFDKECSFDDEDTDENCNQIEDIENNNSFTVHTVCPKDPRCLGICINDHTWTSANKSLYNYVNANEGDLKNNKFKHLIGSSRCGECINNFYQITKLIREKKQCNI
jgi:hypothetical protein